MFFRRPSPLARFFTTYQDRSLLVHEGLDPQWLERLLRQGGGGAPFRIHVGRQDGRGRPTPVEHVVHREILPQGLPLPLLVKVGEDECWLRHLRRGEHLLAAEEVPLVAAEIIVRHHLRLERGERGCQAHGGTLAWEDNELLFPEVDPDLP